MQNRDPLSNGAIVYMKHIWKKKSVQQPDREPFDRKSRAVIEGNFLFGTLNTTED